MCLLSQVYRSLSPPLCLPPSSPLLFILAYIQSSPPPPSFFFNLSLPSRLTLFLSPPQRLDVMTSIYSMSPPDGGVWDSMRGATDTLTCVYMPDGLTVQVPVSRDQTAADLLSAACKVGGQLRRNDDTHYSCCALLTVVVAEFSFGSSRISLILLFVPNGENLFSCDVGMETCPKMLRKNFQLCQVWTC